MAGHKNLIMGVCTALLFFAAVVGPWVFRNDRNFDDPSIAMRGGRVLYYRAMLNNMPADTYRASFYIWSPPPVQNIMEKYLGFSRKDLEKGGAAQWLNRSKSTSFAKDDQKAQKAGRPDLASTYIFKLRAEYVKRVREYAEQGATSPGRSASSSMQSDAIHSILNHPEKYILSFLPLAWQGAWLSNAPWWAGPFLVLSLPAFFVVEVLLRRRWDTAAFAIVPLGFYGIYLAASHMLPRYIEPLTPLYIVSMTGLILLLWQILRARFSRKISRVSDP